MENKFVYFFDDEGENKKELLGGKGANLAEMMKIGILVPQGFTITTEACNSYYRDENILNKSIEEEIYESIDILEHKTGKKFADAKRPLLVSVRSGARVSMPGMMDTILNLGLNDDVVEVLGKETNNKRFAYDSYRRFIQMFSDVVKGVERNLFENVLNDTKELKGYEFDTELDEHDLKEIIEKYKIIYKKEVGEDFPMEPKVQLMEAVKAVFESWNNPRAIIYRRVNDIPKEWGTAVNIQEMVFGNMGEDSGTGVAFSRNPSNGNKEIYGEYLINAQGEDVVAGIRTPLKIEELKERNFDLYKQFKEIVDKLEKHYRDMQDMEFTVEGGKLYFLQTRNGKRTSAAALKIAIDLVEEGLITKEEAILRVDAKQLKGLLHSTFNKKALEKEVPIATGLAASPGAASGKIVFTAEESKFMKKKNEKNILIRLETSPEDIEGMIASEGILTVRGGMTSHAAVVARGMGKCCVSGCSQIKINAEDKIVKVGDITLREGDVISIDGNTGNVYCGDIEKDIFKISSDFEKFMSWADEIRNIEVLTNADTPKDAEMAIRFGAQGIGLCRTEHMFFEKDKIGIVREMILANDTEKRKAALDKLLPIQRDDFIGIYEVLMERPCTIRLLDPPLHEFLPSNDSEINELSKSLEVSKEKIEEAITNLKEVNPMMGHRGCRLGISYPEIIQMQTRAIVEAAIYVNRKLGNKIKPKIMVPLISDVREFIYVKEIIEEEVNKIIKETNEAIKVEIGTMIETPRAALTADEIAKEAEFFSFGTNDLTQMTFGFSRDDAGKFLEDYYEKEVFEQSPFVRIDEKGVGELINLATILGRTENKNLSIGVCGEQAGNSASIEFFDRIGIDYISCSPYRIPIARLAGAQAAVKDKNKL
ncbi:MAG: pyruvate, phosphate dikinase [Sarcina sp.]